MEAVIEFFMKPFEDTVEMQYMIFLSTVSMARMAADGRQCVNLIPQKPFERIRRF